MGILLLTINGQDLGIGYGTDIDTDTDTDTSSRGLCRRCTNSLGHTSPQLAILGKGEKGMYVNLGPFFSTTNF